MTDLADSIRTVIDNYLDKVKPSGPSDVMAVCPFHVKSDGSPEKTPSFAMNLTNGLWFCHACQSKGNLYTFLRDVGVTRAEISFRYQVLIDMASEVMPERHNPLRPQVFTEQEPLPPGFLGVLDYAPVDLLNAGFAESTLQHFDVGFDHYHYRTTYPLRDLAGDLVGISGRSVIGQEPRYKVYGEEYVSWGLPKREPCDKRQLLWNAHNVYPELFFDTDPSYVVLVEGFKACMWLWQAGIKNVVATLGTYLSEEQQWILERMGAPVYLFLDNNWPGRAGAYHTGQKLRFALPLRVIEYPQRLRHEEWAQPDNLTQPEIVQQFSHAADYFEWVGREGLRAEIEKRKKDRELEGTRT
jgi:DNA primase